LLVDFKVDVCGRFRAVGADRCSGCYRWLLCDFKNVKDFESVNDVESANDLQRSRGPKVFGALGTANYLFAETVRGLT